MKRECAECGELFDPYEVDAAGLTHYCSDYCRELDIADDDWDDFDDEDDE